MKIIIDPNFDKALRKLPTSIQRKVLQKVTLFRSDWRHPSLKTYKLKGSKKEMWSFCVTYSVRVVFIFQEDKVIMLLDVGEHDEIY